MATNSNAGRQGTGKTNGGSAGKAGSAVRTGSTARTVSAGGAVKGGNTVRTAGTANAVRTGSAVKAGSTGRTAGTAIPGRTVKAGITTNTGRTVNSGKIVNSGRTANTGSAAKTGTAVSTGKTGGKVQAGSAAKAGDAGRNGKKPHRRLKKSICRTLGALFLASSLVVAAIPVDGLQAAVTQDAQNITHVETEVFKSGIPRVKDDAKVYTCPIEGTGITYWFAYVGRDGTESGEGRYAIILRYEQVGNLAGGILEIPETMQAYRKYSMSSSDTGNAAVNMDGDFLFYREGKQVQKIDPDTNLPMVDVDNKPVYETVYTYYPCYYSTRSTWERLSDFYVLEKDADGKPIKDSYVANSKERIAAAKVAWIGSQRVELDSESGDYKLVKGDGGYGAEVTQANQGVFYNQRNITTLKVPKDVEGVGNYAFANCGFASVEFGNGLRCLGNNAFEGCGTMTSITIPKTCSVDVIGKECFKGCGNLRSIEVPNGVREIGDSAFENCKELKNIIMIYPNEKDDKGVDAPLEGNLTTLGYHVFKGCTNLQYLEFPTSYTGPADVCEFDGCTSLEYIRTGYRDKEDDGNSDFTLKEGDDPNFGWAKFKGQFPKLPNSDESTFYLWGPKESKKLDGTTIGNLHYEATRQHIAYKFYDRELRMDVYEKVMSGKASDGSDVDTVFWVNDNNELVKCDIESGTAPVAELTLPEAIGPKNINSIGETTFQDKCSLKVVTIPASVRSIAKNAFKGSHNLKTVIFTGAENVQSIGSGAFNTQQICVSHADFCDGKVLPEWHLNLVGTISIDHIITVPFKHAMSDPSTIGLKGSGIYNTTLLTYYSGFPTNLVVRRNEVTGLSELIDYATYSDLKDLRYTKDNGYDYMSSEDEAVVKNKIAPASFGSSLETYPRSVLDAVVNLNLPDGIQSIAMVRVTRDDDGNVIRGELEKNVPTASQVTKEDDAFAQGDDGERMLQIGSEDSELMGLFRYRENYNYTIVDPKKETEEDQNKGISTYDDSVASSRNDNYYANLKTENLRKSLTAENVQLIAPGAFRNCDAFETVSLKGDLKAVGHYAFADCDNLKNVSISESVQELGRVPFIGCTALSDVDFGGSEKYVTEKSILYRLDGDKKSKLVEVLCERTPVSIDADELAAVPELGPEAFRRTNVRNVDLSQSTIREVPESAFRETLRLSTVTLPDTCKIIGDYAFADSAINEIKIPASVTRIYDTAFDDVVKDEPYQDVPNYKELIIYAPENSEAYLYAKSHTPTIYWQDRKDPTTFTAIFYGDHGNVLDIQYKCLIGSTLKAPIVPAKEGYNFVGWNKPLEDIQEEDLDQLGNYVVSALYEEIKAVTYTVEFLDYDGSLIDERSVGKGEDASKLIKDPSRGGYDFTGWVPSPSNVTGDMTTVAQYERIDESKRVYYTVTFLDYDGKVINTQEVEKGKDAVIPQSPTREGYTFVGWVPNPVKVNSGMTPVAQYTQNSSSSGNGSGNGSSGGNNNNNNNSNGSGNSSGGGSGDNSDDGGDDGDDWGGGDSGDEELYKLTVVNGSGSGSYPAGTQCIILADQASSTQVFDHWTIQPEQAAIASLTQAGTVISMPHCEVIVTAHYRTVSGGGSTTVNPPTNTNRPTGGNNNTTGGSTVVIDKNGLSNTGVVNVVINGSSDNFVMKIGENSSATESIIKALIAEYGSIENIKYFPMDITLYDSTGTRRITDTTGLKIDVTLPLPDSLKIYAGNNKVAGVVNDRLDKLSPKFTTINGVPCVTFSAEHFSPYVIYVDTSRLGQGTTADDTPKTGDPIHPKWFLSIGLACLSFVMFMQKDTKKKKKVAVRAR